VERISQAIILAGGAGTRLRPVVSDVPKPLAPVCGRPFIEYLIAQLAAAGIPRAVVLAGVMADRLRSTLGDQLLGVEIVYSVEPAPLGTAGALKHAETMLDGDRWLLLNGDSLVDIDLSALSDAHRPDAALATMALVRVDDSRRFGGVSIARDGSVVSFVEKPNSSEATLINAGVYVIERRLLNEIPADAAVSLERAILPALIGRGLRGEAFSAYFVDIGVPEDYLRAQQACAVFDGLIRAAER
jgi:NDP-sugar pyrophosphorylase family protein